MTLQIKGASKKNAKKMKKVGASPQGKDFFDAKGIERTLDHLYSLVKEKKEKSIA